MQSSATVACRAGVMLICLIAIPLAALFGTRLPDLVQQLLDRQSGKTGAQERDLLAEAPAFEGMAPASPWAGGPNSATPGKLESSVPPVGDSQAIRAGYESPVEAMPTSDAVGWPAESPPQPFEATDRFAGIQQRLRELGATYYVLETWGDRGEYYRFHARMALGTGEDHVRHFDATDTDPLAAMARVLSEVERWRASE